MKGTKWLFNHSGKMLYRYQYTACCIWIKLVHKLIHMLSKSCLCPAASCGDPQAKLVTDSSFRTRRPFNEEKNLSPSRNKARISKAKEPTIISGISCVVFG
uniref:Methylcobalamin:com methyltransferase n=1 Tax=Rhizophora mucronata TaxID=61149 RepID=A0A2P2K241_RHIMU